MTEINIGNAHLASNIHANIGSLYRMTGKYSLAKENMEKSAKIIIEYNLCSHDNIPQMCNIASYFNDFREYDSSYKILKFLEYLLKSNNLDMNTDYAIVKELLGDIYLNQGKTLRATLQFKRAIRIYEYVWKDEPEQLRKKYKEIQEKYERVGIEKIPSIFLKYNN